MWIWSPKKELMSQNAYLILDPAIIDITKISDNSRVIDFFTRLAFPVQCDNGYSTIYFIGGCLHVMGHHLRSISKVISDNLPHRFYERANETAAWDGQHSHSHDLRDFITATPRAVHFCQVWKTDIKDEIMIGIYNPETKKKWMVFLYPHRSSSPLAIRMASLRSFENGITVANAPLRESLGV